MTADIDKLTPFNYATIPYGHQEKIFLESRDAIHYALFWEMGTGKSKVIIDTVAHLFMERRLDGLIIVSDKGCYLNWYYNEIPLHMSPEIYYRMAFWSSSLNKEERWELQSIMNPSPNNYLDILCVNVEAMSTKRAFNIVLKFAKTHACMLCVDESTSIKNPKAARTSNLIKLSRICYYHRIMSGTPVTQSPLDLYSQCDFLKKGLLGFKSYFQFRHYFAEYQTIKMGTRSFPKLMGFRNLEELTTAIQPFSSRILKSECLDLPDKVYETRYVELTSEQLHAYDKLKKEAVMHLESGDVTITSALTLLMKLHQITCGHIIDDEGHVTNINNNRIPALIDVLHEAQGKVIIWCNFTQDVRTIRLKLFEEFGDESCVDYYGETPDQQRQFNLSQFHNNEECRFFVGTAQTGGKGLTLVEANTVVYYSNSFKLETRLQSEDRAHRIGQKNNVLYVDIVAKDTIDVKILAALKQKKNIADQILDNWREILTFSP